METRNSYREFYHNTNNTINGFFEHRVSNLDTLAGIAIKYGVEVADIKQINGLATDLQMFGRKSLRIPQPAKHPTSPSFASGHNDSEQIETQQLRCNFLDSFQSLRITSTSQHKVSPAMSSLQGYYGLKQENNNVLSDGCEMTVYRQGGDSEILEDSSFLNPVPLGVRKKSRSLNNGLLVAHNGDDELSDNILVPCLGEFEPNIKSEKPVPRRQNSVTDFTSSTTPEMLLKDENSLVSGFSAKRGKGKGLALRPKAANRNPSPASVEVNVVVNPAPLALGDCLSAERLSGVRKSSSLSCLNEKNGSSTSIWSQYKWNLKPDLQALSSAAIPKPLFDSRRNKAALD